MTDIFSNQPDDYEVELTAPQLEIFESEHEYVAGVAGMGAGKTQVAAVKLLDKMCEYPTINFAYLAPTYSLIRDIFYPKFSELLSELGVPYQINKSENIIYVAGCGQLFCRTMDNPEMIIGWECGDAVMDEFDVLDTDKAKLAMRKVSARCRQKFPDGKKNQKYVITTPEGFKATYELFKKKPLVDSHLVQMSTFSNKKNLAPGYIEGLFNQYPQALRDAYLGGKFVNLKSGTVYSYFDRSRHHTDEVIKPGEQIHVGQDFNYGGCVSSCFVIRDGSPMLLDGYVSVDTYGIIEETKRRFKRNVVTFYPDASGEKRTSNASKSDIDLLREAGFRIVCDDSNPLVRDRVNSVNRLFDKNIIKVNCNKVPEHVEALEKQAWDQKTGNPEKHNEPASVDDYNDSVGYFVYQRFPITQVGFSNSQSVR